MTILRRFDVNTRAGDEVFVRLWQVEAFKYAGCNIATSTPFFAFPLEKRYRQHLVSAGR